MIKKVALIGGAISLGLLLTSNTQAVEPLSKKELSSHCSHYFSNPQGPDASFCIRYIQGFIDGAIATDERVTLNVAAEYSRSEEYAERAMRTRGATKLSRYGPTVYADFCLGEPVPLKVVVEQVVRDLENTAVTNTDLNARTAVYRTLREAFPCKTTSS